MVELVQNQGLQVQSNLATEPYVTFAVAEGGGGDSGDGYSDIQIDGFLAFNQGATTYTKTEFHTASTAKAKDLVKLG